VSDIPTDWREQLNLRDEIARIDRNRAETQKLYAEGHKFEREPWILALVALIGAFAVIMARLPELLRAFGIG
jgi:hypothetical protein